VEDTDAVTFESIQERFGPAVRRIVEGETKVSKVSSSVSKQGPGGGDAGDAGGGDAAAPALLNGEAQAKINVQVRWCRLNLDD
jgi:hypothetical protein